MSWISSILIGVLTGVVALFCAGLTAAGSASWHRMSNFEGAAGYFVVLVAILGGIVGFFLGVVTSRMMANPVFFKALGLSCGITVGIAAIAALISWVVADIPPKIAGRELELEVEIRLPLGEPKPATSPETKSHLRLGSVINHVQRKSKMGKLNLDAARLERGRWIIPGSVFLFTTRGKRSVDGEIDCKSIGGFIIPLPARPSAKYEQWSDWGPQPPAGSPPWPNDKPSYRFRVVRQVPGPREADPEVVKGEEFAALAALEPDASLEKWLDFLAYGAPEDRTKAIMQVVEARPGELAEAIRSPDEELRNHALWAVTILSKVDPAVSEAVQAEGRIVAESLRRFNEMSATDTQFLNIQVPLRSRFNTWRHAWWTVHQLTGIDGRPPVQEMHDLALVRAKETTLDEIVINARAHLEALPPKESEALPSERP